MDSAVVNRLSRVLDDLGKQQIVVTDAKEQIAGILSGRSREETLQELDSYVPGSRNKEKDVLIVMMALLRLNLSSGPDLAREIQSRGYELAGPLYGGLTMLFSGRNRNFTFQPLVLRRDTKNAYEEIALRWDNHFFFSHIHLFLTTVLLHRLDPGRFEQLALKDPSGILLLMMVQRHLPIPPSDDLLKKLLESPNPLHPNFALAFYAQLIPNLCGIVSQKTARRGDIKRLNQQVDRCLAALRPCSPSLRAELLTNYLLVHSQQVPVAFARQLVGAELQSEFIGQITEPGKIRTIRKLVSVASLIAKTPACNQQKRRISKRPLVNALLSVLMRFVQECTGIYEGDWQEDAKAILRLLTAQQKRRFGSFLNSQDSTLMISPLDELVRFDIYLKDIRQHQIIQGLQNCLAHSP